MVRLIISQTAPFFLMLVVGALASPRLHAQSPTFDWATKLPGTGEYYAIDFVADHEGSGVLAHQVGCCTGTTGDVLTKIDASGGVRWTKRVLPHIQQLATDLNGNIYVAGGNLRLVAGLVPANYFESIGIATEGSGSAYVAKFDPAGSLEWVRLAGNTPSIDATCVAVDSEGNYYSAGNYWNGEAEFGDNRLPAKEPDPEHPMASNCFIAKHDRDGRLQWVRAATSSFAWPRINKIAIDPAGNVFVAGWSFEPVSFGDVVVAPSFLVKFDRDGKLLWTRVGGGAVAVDHDGNAFVSATVGLDVMLTKYTPAGDLLWTRRSQVDGAQAYDTKLAVDSDGNCLLGGILFSGQPPYLISFGDVTLTTVARKEAFVVKYTRSGDVRWAIQTEGLDAAGNGTSTRISTTHLAGVAMDPLGGIFIGGDFAGTVQFGTTNLVGSPNNGNSNLFVSHIIDPDAVRPVLKIVRTANGVTLSWPRSSNGFVLETAITLPASNWSAVLDVPSLDGDQNVVTLEIGSGPRFFRLRK